MTDNIRINDIGNVEYIGIELYLLHNYSEPCEGGQKHWATPLLITTSGNMVLDKICEIGISELQGYIRPFTKDISLEYRFNLPPELPDHGFPSYSSLGCYTDNVVCYRNEAGFISVRTDQGLLTIKAIKKD